MPPRRLAGETVGPYGAPRGRSGRPTRPRRRSGARRTRFAYGWSVSGKARHRASGSGRVLTCGRRDISTYPGRGSGHPDATGGGGTWRAAIPYAIGRPISTSSTMPTSATPSPVGRAAPGVPDRPHGPPGAGLAADDLCRRHHAGQGRGALQLVQHQRDRLRGGGRESDPHLRPPTDHLRPTAPHVDPSSPPALVLAHEGGGLRTDDQVALRVADRGAPGGRPRRCGFPSTRSRSRCG